MILGSGICWVYIDLGEPYKTLIRKVPKRNQAQPPLSSNNIRQPGNTSTNEDTATMASVVAETESDDYYRLGVDKCYY